jgi:hypothetical protein
MRKLLSLIGHIHGSLFLAAALLVGGLVAITSGLLATPAAAVVSCPSGQDPYTFSSAQMTACGDTVYPLVSVTTLPDGGKDYRYSNGSGTLIPPSSFNPSTASDAQLTEYNLPLRPSSSNAAAYNAWMQTIGSITHWAGGTHSLIEAPVTSQGSIPSPTSGSVSPALSGSCSQCWSGYADANQTNYTQAYAKWTQGTPGYSRCDPGTSYVSWTGIGGYGLPNLGQDGTGYGVGGLGPNEAWTEVLPGQNITDVPGLYATEGQAFEAYTTWQNGGGQYDWLLQNDYTHAGYSGHTATNNYSGGSVEWIIEGPSSHTFGGTGLTNFGTVQFTASEAWNWGALVGPSTAQSIVMTNGSGNAMATPSALTWGYTVSTFSITQNSCA